MKFSNGNFLISVKYVFSNKNSNEENGGIDFFLSTCLKVINKHWKVYARQSETFHEQSYLERDYEEIEIKKLIVFKNKEWCC